MAISQRRAGGQAERLPKYVVSATLASPAWNNSTVLKGDVLDEVSTLKQRIWSDAYRSPRGSAQDPGPITATLIWGW